MNHTSVDHNCSQAVKSGKGQRQMRQVKTEFWAPPHPRAKSSLPSIGEIVKTESRNLEQKTFHAGQVSLRSPGWPDLALITAHFKANCLLEKARKFSFYSITLH